MQMHLDICIVKQRLTKLAANYQRYIAADLDVMLMLQIVSFYTWSVHISLFTYVYRIHETDDKLTHLAQTID